MEAAIAVSIMSHGNYDRMLASLDCFEVWLSLSTAGSATSSDRQMWSVLVAGNVYRYLVRRVIIGEQ